MNIVDLFDERANAQPESQALIDMSRRRERIVSFGELQDYSVSIAAQLTEDGLQPGDRVLVALPVSVHLYASLLGIWRLGAVAVFPDPGARRKQLVYCCEKAAAQAFIGSTKAHLLRLLVPSVRRIHRHYGVHPWLPGARALRLTQQPKAQTSKVRHAATLPPESPALITFTSGSTGLPKAAARSHGFLIAQYHSVCRTLSLEPGQRDITTLPVFVLANLAAGVTTLLPPGNLRRPGQVPPAPILHAMQRHRITRASGSPAFFERLAEGLTDANHPKLQSLHTGGAPVTPALLHSLSILTETNHLCAVYGSTEAEPIAELAYTSLTNAQKTGPALGKGLPAGLPVPDIDLVIVPPEHIKPSYPTEEAWRAETIKPGQPGEIVVAGDHVLQGYLDGVGDETTKITVGNRRWHRTGDAGYLDQTGGLWLLGRVSAAADIEGLRRYPFELEYPAMEHPGVKRAALVNHPEGARLVIEPFPGSRVVPEDIAERLPFNFPAYRVSLVNRIPLDSRHNAKVDYDSLRRVLPS